MEESFITIAEVKKHLVIDDDFTDDDDYISMLIDSAIEVTEKEIAWEVLPETQEEYGTDLERYFEGNVPKSIKLAIMILVEDWYKNRGTNTSIAVNELPKSYDYLVSKYTNHIIK